MSGVAKVAVAGGTGMVGRLVVTGLMEAGIEAVALARSNGVDLRTARGLEDGLAGVHAVIDVSNNFTTRRSNTFFTTATGHLLEAGRRAGVQHHVVLSIVGCERVPSGYYEVKRRQEDLVLDSGVPATVLRTTQFHEFAGQVSSRASLGPFVVVPRMRIQPIAAAEVAAALVEIVQGPAVGFARELAGPREEQLVHMVRRLLRCRERRRLVVPLRAPGAAGRAVAGGALLPSNGSRRGVQMFEQWLMTKEVDDDG